MLIASSVAESSRPGDAGCDTIATWTWTPVVSPPCWPPGSRPSSRPQEDLTTCLEYGGTGEECAADAARHALDALQDYIAEAIHDPWPGQRTMPEPHAQVRDSALHLWYGPADDLVLACEPMPLADLMDG